jgi:hypothetical protein
MLVCGLIVPLQSPSGISISLLPKSLIGFFGDFLFSMNFSFYITNIVPNCNKKTSDFGFDWETCQRLGICCG